MPYQPLPPLRLYPLQVPIGTQSVPLCRAPPQQMSRSRRHSEPSRSFATGNVWTRNVGDAHEQQLTQSGDMSEPAWSASGAWLSAREHTDERQTPSLVTTDVATQHSVVLNANV